MRAALVLLTGCALFSKATPIETHYFSPELPQGPGTTQARRFPWPGREAPRLRLGRITPSSYLREEIVHRASNVEVALYETRLWTERPEQYVRRALERALFERRGLEEAIGGPATTLDVELIAFEEVRAPRHAGRVQLRYRLRDDRSVLDSGVVAVERGVAGPAFAAVVAAIGAALTEATSRLADRVVRQLEHPPQHPESPDRSDRALPPAPS
jgi:cholesterol transport system auxiliary component